MDVKNGTEYAEMICRQLEGRPMRNLHGLLAAAWNAGAVFMLLNAPKPKRKRRIPEADRTSGVGATAETTADTKGREG